MKEGEKEMNVFTFWEGKMPDYIQLCMKTWRFPYIMLNYDNLHEYTDLDINLLKRFTLPQIADVVRAHVLRDHGGYWLDTDTIMMTDELPDYCTIMGYPDTRANTIGFLYAAEPHEDFFERWADYQEVVLKAPNSSRHWSAMGNIFTDKYLSINRSVAISWVERRWPETYMIKEDMPRNEKYRLFYFYSMYHLKDIMSTDMLMLHNSWTPGLYKDMPVTEVLSQRCTLSNILRELL